jgi:hypothetical protein
VVLAVWLSMMQPEGVSLAFQVSSVHPRHVVNLLPDAQVAPGV